MSASPRTRGPHPWLLDPAYWRSRQADPGTHEPSLFIVPRPDLSSPTVDVGELRLRAHDGIRLWGMMGRCTLAGEQSPVRVRLLDCGQPLEIDRDAVKSGAIDFVLQEPVGRRLEDRVLDVLRAFETARKVRGADPQGVRLVHLGEQPLPDEFVIADRLLHEGAVQREQPAA